MTTENRWLALVVLCVGMLMIVLDVPARRVRPVIRERHAAEPCAEPA